MSVAPCSKGISAEEERVAGRSGHVLGISAVSEMAEHEPRGQNCSLPVLQK